MAGFLRRDGNGKVVDALRCPLNNTLPIPVPKRAFDLLRGPISFHEFSAQGTANEPP